jgi:hypothetical protein
MTLSNYFYIEKACLLVRDFAEGTTPGTRFFAEAVPGVFS